MQTGADADWEKRHSQGSVQRSERVRFGCNRGTSCQVEHAYWAVRCLAWEVGCASWQLCVCAAAGTGLWDGLQWVVGVWWACPALAAVP
jgi:hypothetical protein